MVQHACSTPVHHGAGHGIFLKKKENKKQKRTDDPRACTCARHFGRVPHGDLLVWRLQDTGPADMAQHVWSTLVHRAVIQVPLGLLPPPPLTNKRENVPPRLHLCAPRLVHLLLELIFESCFQGKEPHGMVQHACSTPVHHRAGHGILLR